MRKIKRWFSCRRTLRCSELLICHISIGQERLETSTVEQCINSEPLLIACTSTTTSRVGGTGILLPHTTFFSRPQRNTKHPAISSRVLVRRRYAERKATCGFHSSLSLLFSSSAPPHQLHFRLPTPKTLLLKGKAVIFIPSFTLFNTKKWIGGCGDAYATPPRMQGPLQQRNLRLPD